MKIKEVRTEKYERTWGKKPRGKGMWAFGNSSESQVWFFYGSYSDTKKQAIQKANEEFETHEALYVLP